jgi:hypothetical protein
MNWIFIAVIKALLKMRLSKLRLSDPYGFRKGLGDEFALAQQKRRAAAA